MKIIVYANTKKLSRKNL